MVVKHETKKGLLAWCLYDWANSAFPTVIITFVFATYFSKGVARDEVSGMSDWGLMISISAIAVAFCGPVLGAIADHSGNRKPWLFVFTALCVLACANLWNVQANTQSVLLALILVGVANFAFEMGAIFYNAMLANLAPINRVGRWSGWGWAIGYFGGLACLGLTLICFVNPKTSWFNLDKSASEHLRITGPMVGIWFTVFALPLFLWTPDKPANCIRIHTAIIKGVETLRNTFKSIANYPNVWRFLIARMVYTDGLNTLFAMGGIYAAGTFGFSFKEIIMFGIAINVSAGIGAGAFAWVDDWIGPEQTIAISLGALILLSSILLIIETQQQFWIFGTALGIFVGPTQSASRSLMIRLAPNNLLNEMFGFYAFSGKATAFLGPALLASVATAFESQRAGMATIVAFFSVGLILLLNINRRH